jgi:hypothetical protein
MEFLEGGQWNHLLTVHEAKLNLVKAAIDDATAYLTKLSEDALSAVQHDALGRFPDGGRALSVSRERQSSPASRPF